jgi:hypothetical protein
MSLSPIDLVALARALDTARKTPAEAKRIDGKLASGGDWFDLATGCAFRCQTVALNLQPWQSPPMYGDVIEPRVDQPAFDLLRKLLSLGLSRYEPDPVRAIERAEKRAVTPASNASPR